MAKPTLLHIYPTFELGGAQRRFVQLANHFGGDYRHLIVSLKGGTQAKDLLGSHVDASLVEPPGGAGLRDRLSRIRALLRSLSPDLLVTSNWGSIEWAMANLDGLVPHLHMEDGFGPEESRVQLPRRVWTRRLVLRRSTIMLPSHTLYLLARDVWRLPKKRLVQVPNGIDCARFTPEIDNSFVEHLGIRRDRPVIGTVAALRKEKNLGRLIEAFAQLRARREAQLVIVGDGTERAALDAKCAELGVAGDVLFTGACSTPERILPAFTLFALSSDTEQMPLSLLEAMAAGRPVAATDVGDVRHMLATDNQPYVVPRDADALAATMLSLLETPALDSLGAANRQRVETAYDQSRMFEAYRALYEP